MKSAPLLAVVLVALGASGCASIFTGTQQTITVNSNPTGAQVLVNGAYVGVTPVRADVKRSNDVHVVVRAQGYPDKAFLLRKDFNYVAALNLFFFPCWIVDFATGAMFRLDPEAVYATMDPNAPPSPGQILNAPGYPGAVIAPATAPTAAPDPWKTPPPAPPPPPPPPPPR